jgi:hypothetical protein
MHVFDVEKISYFCCKKFYEFSGTDETINQFELFPQQFLGLFF